MSDRAEVPATTAGATEPVPAPVELDRRVVSRARPGVEPFLGDGRAHAGFEARGELRRKDFGLTTGLLAGTMLGELVKIELDVQFIEPAPAQADA